MCSEVCSVCPGCAYMYAMYGQIACQFPVKALTSGNWKYCEQIPKKSKKGKKKLGLKSTLSSLHPGTYVLVAMGRGGGRKVSRCWAG